MAHGRKAIIKATDAVGRIRSGTTDTSLMRFYSISAKGLDSLFGKLVAAGLISQEELQQRFVTSTLSHVVDLDWYPPFPRERGRVRIQTSEAVRLIRSGMSDIALMEKFGISTRGLESLFRKLVAAGAISQEYLDERQHAAQWAEVAFIDFEDPSLDRAVDSECDLPPGKWFVVEAFHKYKLQAGMLLGFVAGVLACLSVYLWLATSVPVPDRFRLDSARPQPELSSASIELQAEQLTRTLESIFKDRTDPAKVDSSMARSDFQECMKNCEKQFSNTDDTDRVLSFNCKKACIAEFNDLVKKLRQRYYDNPDPH